MRSVTAICLAAAFLALSRPPTAQADGAVAASSGDADHGKPVANTGAVGDDKSIDDLVAPMRGKPKTTVGGATRGIEDEKKSPSADGAKGKAPEAPPH